MDGKSAWGSDRPQVQLGLPTYSLINLGKSPNLDNIPQNHCSIDSKNLTHSHKLPLSLGSNPSLALPGCVTLARNFTPMSLSFFICKMGIMAGSTWWGQP